MAKAMIKDVNMSFKVERELRDEFAAVAKRQHRTASQMLREFMWAEIEGVKVPNAETRAAMEESRSGGGTRFTNLDDLFRDLGIPCEK